MALGLDHLEPECQKVELNPAVVMRLLDRRMTEATSVGGLMLLRVWGPPNFLLHLADMGLFTRECSLPGDSGFAHRQKVASSRAP